MTRLGWRVLAGLHPIQSGRFILFFSAILNVMTSHIPGEIIIVGPCHGSYLQFSRICIWNKSFTLFSFSQLFMIKNLKPNYWLRFLVLIWDIGVDIFARIFKNLVDDGTIRVTRERIIGVFKVSESLKYWIYTRKYSETQATPAMGQNKKSNAYTSVLYVLLWEELTYV